MCSRLGLTLFGGRGRASQWVLEHPHLPVERPPGGPPLAGPLPCPPEGRSQAVRAVERKCVRSTSAASDIQPCSRSPSPLHESLPRYLPRLHLSRARPVTRLIGDHFRLPWTYSPPQTHPPDLISHPVLFWRLASLTGGRSRSFLLFFFFQKRVFPTRGLGTCPVSVNRLPSVNGIWVTTRSRAGQRTSFFPTPVQKLVGLCLPCVLCVWVCVCVGSS